MAVAAKWLEALWVASGNFGEMNVLTSGHIWQVPGKQQRSRLQVSMSTATAAQSPPKKTKMAIEATPRRY